uniref:Uncharacterized protein n=1 Tax=Macrostomum lignano TaxID=282301 RepID=A0A1I8FPR5_9PLAT
MALADSNSLINLAPAGPAKRRGPGLRRQRHLLGRLWRLCCSRGPAAQLSEAACSCAGPAPRTPEARGRSTSNLTARARPSAKRSTNPEKLSTAVRVDDDGGDDSGTGSTPVSEDLVRHPEPVPRAPSCQLCARTWCGGPHAAQGNCLIERGQRAYLNALQPSSLPMQYLIAAVAARLDIEVPLLDSQRPGYSRGCQAQRVQLTDRITDIDHPAGQSGDRGIPGSALFIAGSPGWLTKAK